MMPKVFAIISLLFLFSCRSGKELIDTTTVSELNPDKYQGTWYEIARFQHSFEKNLVGVTANYEWLDNGMIKVTNAGYKDSLDGEYKEAIGKAKIPDSNEPGKLKVSFFLFFYGDYNVLALDENYQYTLVGSSTPGYLWILSRTPELDNTTYNMLVNEAKLRGYDTEKLFKVPQQKEVVH